MSSIETNSLYQSLPLARSSPPRGLDLRKDSQSQIVRLKRPKHSMHHSEDQADKTIFHKYGQVYAKPLFVASPYLESNGALYKKVFKPNPSTKLRKIQRDTTPKLRHSSQTGLDQSLDSEKTAEEKPHPKSYVVKSVFASSTSIRTPYEITTMPKILQIPRRVSPDPPRAPTVPQEPRWFKQSVVKLHPLQLPNPSASEPQTFYYVTRQTHLVRYRIWKQRFTDHLVHATTTMVEKL